MKDIYLILDQLNIKYHKYNHPAVFTVEESESLHLDIPGAHSKNLFLRNKKKTAYYLVTVLADKRVNLNQLTKELGEDKLSFASPEDLKKYLGLTPGSVSVFGLINNEEKNITVIVDQDFFGSEEIGFHPNDNTATLVIKTEDLKKFLDFCGNQIVFKNI
ncbi:MAG: prolyl-tRNA synthetase associated domain-containing protein [Patescibacteria group bacterium]